MTKQNPSDNCKHCGACRNPDPCDCCGACRTCGKVHPQPAKLVPQPYPVPYPVPYRVEPPFRVEPVADLPWWQFEITCGGRIDEPRCVYNGVTAPRLPPNGGGGTWQQ